MTEITAYNVDLLSLSGCAPRSSPCATLARLEQSRDRRFESLLGRDAWLQLPDAVRRRFSRAIAPGGQRIFAGTIKETRLSPVGRALAQLARLIGGPLPLTDGATGPTSVIVTEDADRHGQIWTRIYSRPGRFPQTINSMKRAYGADELEEYLGFGLVMRLRLSAEDGALVFRSNGYRLCIGRHRIALPTWASPGACTVTHRAIGPDRFTFTLTLDHPWAGRLAFQDAEFVETEFEEDRT